jgi:hypothetical protein
MLRHQEASRASGVSEKLVGGTQGVSSLHGARKDMVRSLFIDSYHCGVTKSQIRNRLLSEYRMAFYLGQGTSDSKLVWKGSITHTLSVVKRANQIPKKLQQCSSRYYYKIL